MPALSSPETLLNRPEPAEPTPEFAPDPPPDARSLHRIPVRLVVSNTESSAPLGRTRDISLMGLYLETPRPFPVGTVVPLAIELGAERPLRLRAEVVRVDPTGMGLCFSGDDPSALRTLRRWINDSTSAAGTQRLIHELNAASALVEPIREPADVRGLLERVAESGAPLTLVPPERFVQEQARLGRVGPDGLVLTTPEPTTLTVGESVFVLVTVAFTSYTFTVRTLAVGPASLTTTLPERVVRSERRTRDRQKVPAGSVLRWPAPWVPGGMVAVPLVERSRDGVGFRVTREGCLLTPGAILSGAELVVGGVREPIPVAVVRHLSPIPGDENGLHVGVAIGEEWTGTALTRARDDGTPTWWGRPAAWARRLVAAVGYGYWAARRRLAPSAADDELLARRLTIPNGNLPLVALLERTRADEGRLRCPLVIVVPGFAGRKEQTSFLAGTILDGFRRRHRDVAVLRFDGSNNLGESGKDPDCVSEGLHALHYTTSGTVEDVLAVLRWARRNDVVDPTHLVLVSVSMSSVAVRHVLARPEASDVGLWVSYMGAADAFDAVLRVSGNIDLAARRRSGQPLGVVSIAGVLTDGDRYFADLEALDLGDLPAAKAEMAKVRADVYWVQGLHDAWMDPRRVGAMMGVAAPGARELVEVESGHLPRTGDLAISHFVRITQRIWRHVHGEALPAFTPPVGRLAVAGAAEWSRVRRAPLADRRGWWSRYLVDPEHLGFDILEFAPAYRSFMELQAELASPAGRRVLELGAGTGNLTRRLLAQGAAEVVAVDLVPEALAVLRQKVGDTPAVMTLAHDVDGGPLLAMRRFLAGEFASPRVLAERVPGVPRPTLDQLLADGHDDIHALLRGRELDLAGVVAQRRLPAQAAALLADLATLARVANRQLDVATASFGLLPTDVVLRPSGLPFGDGSFDVVATSLVLSYLDHADDVCFEAARVLRPGGRLVVSSMLLDSESSKLYHDLLERLEALPDADLPAGVDRARLLESARAFVEHASELFRLEEEGHFRFHTPASLGDLVRRAGFVDVQVERSFGEPAQAVVVTCRKP